ncbi:jasmonic acid carboxyl methyltransferase [Hibiscus trionum]|uniref:Jasmonic acid carboxyl methyltransferase n=1 Tax=Hibiscus trionum TaxID=183268 RepID=A0A9W7HN94_HIBTR|nr:jasmonic acid carboxyl methyltransferase [Hibiscus trionum]
MKVEQVLHMKGGVGKDGYGNNSSHQRTVISMVKPLLAESIIELYSAMPSAECLKIADLGCSAGPNTLLVVSEIIDIIDETCQRLKRTPPCLQAFLNDLAGNDFNAIFTCSLPSFYESLEKEKGTKFGNNCFVAGVPGSFYGRLFPPSSLHFVHSSYAIMWISKAPTELVTKTGTSLNKGNICVAKTSPPAVFEAYLEQFQRDFAVFLRCRADEVVPGGRMLLTTMGSIKSNDPLTIWEFVGLKLNEMVVEGLIENEKLESFDLPYYAASGEELRSVIEAEGSFELQKPEAFNMDWDDYIKKADGDRVLDKAARAAIIARDIRAVGEPILASHFGEDIMDDLFRRFEQDVLDYMKAHKCQYINIVMSLTKKDI